MPKRRQTGGKKRVSTLLDTDGVFSRTRGARKKRKRPLDDDEVAAAIASTDERPAKKRRKRSKAPAVDVVVEIDKAAVEAFLKLVVEGKQEESEAALKDNPSLCLSPADVTDRSERQFTNITGLKYALWCLDTPMWQMMQKYVPPEQFTAQLQSLVSDGTSHGTAADWRGLVEVLRPLGSQYWGCETLKQRALNYYAEIADAQYDLPVHVVNTYCDSRQNFVRQLFDADSLERTTTIHLDRGGTADWYEHIKATRNTAAGFPGFFCGDGRSNATPLFLEPLWEVEDDTDDLDGFDVPGYDMYENLSECAQIDVDAMRQYYTLRRGERDALEAELLQQEAAEVVVSLSPGC